MKNINVDQINLIYFQYYLQVNLKLKVPVVLDLQPVQLFSHQENNERT